MARRGIRSELFFRTFFEIEFRAIPGSTGSSVNGGRVEKYYYEKSGFLNLLAREIADAVLEAGVRAFFL